VSGDDGDDPVKSVNSTSPEVTASNTSGNTSGGPHPFAHPWRDGGGPVMPGRPYRINERGEEGFVPGTKGTIIPTRTMKAAAVASAMAAPALAAADSLPTIQADMPKIDTTPVVTLTSHLARDGGGPVMPGRLYRINERGEEGFVPGTKGTITPTRTMKAAAAASAIAAPAMAAAGSLPAIQAQMPRIDTRHTLPKMRLLQILL
jgi:hypothetical protein